MKIAPVLIGIVLMLLPCVVLAAEDYDVVIERGVEAEMRDGVTLRADIYRPKNDGQFPAILQRTPYDKRGGVDFGLRAAKQGYIFVVQDVRGRYSSEGEWYPFKYESQDGYDSVEWVASLSYSNGKVGMIGGSYVGATQMLAAIAQPPHLCAIFPVVTASNYHANWTYQGGAFEQWFNQSWTTGLAVDTLSRRVRQSSNPLQWSNELPLGTYSLLNLGTPEGLADYYRDWLAHPLYDDYWKQWSIEEYHSKILVPAYHVAAWYDIFLGGSLNNYNGIKTKGGSEAAQSGQRLLVLLGGHAGSGPTIGEVDFGEQPLDLDGVALRWYDYILKGIANGVENEKPVKLFVMGRNLWREEDEWPLARAQSSHYYLHAGGGANVLGGDGSLSPQKPANEPSDKYVYDPDDPVPTRGGQLCCDAAHLPPGAFDQRPVEARKDVLVYSTEPFTEEFEVTGPVTLDLYVSSTAVDTDFTAKLIDVWPNGFAQNLTDGILRTRYRNSPEEPEFMNPGEIYRITVDLWATSNVFLQGHRLRLEVSSSNFPRFDRNLNTGDEPGSSSRKIRATNTIYHDGEHPSALILPIVRP